MSFRENLKYLREEKEISQKELAKACNLSPQCICNLEQGTRNPTGSTVTALAVYFGVSADYLLGLVDEFGTPTFTAEEKAAGFSDKRKVSITPIEDDMLYIFRQVGKKRGEEAQRGIITMLEKMI